MAEGGIADLAQPPTTVRVSSTLNGDSRQFGKKYLTDGSEETCWNSDQGTPQHILLDFGRPVVPKTLRVQFQGGFVGKEVALLASAPVRKGAEKRAGPALEKLGDVWPADDSTLQEFAVPCAEPVSQLKIVFNGSTDFYGRVTVYRLELHGTDHGGAG